MLALGKSPFARPLRLVVFAVLAYAFCWVKGWPREYDDEELPPSQRSKHDAHRVDSRQLVVSVLTTATDVYSKVAPSIVYLNDADHDSLLHFGDLQMAVGRWPIFDVLARFPRKYIQATDELAAYRRQLDYARNGIPLEQLRERDPLKEKARLATLNKYKILQAMDDAWQFRPNRTWYAFVDDDTFIDRTNLLDWLSHHDGNTTRFFANAPAANAPDVFAAGGSSFVLSGRAMKELLHVRKDIIKNWTPYIADHSSALELVTDVVQRELGVQVEGVWPGISGFAPSNVPFGPYALWCEPVMMLHHVPVDTASDIWRLQKARSEDVNATGPFVFAHLWHHLISTKNLRDPRDDWDNLSSDFTNSNWNILFQGTEPDANRAEKGEASWQACQTSCQKNEYCVQWSYSSVPTPNWNENRETHCHLSSSIRFGAHTPPQELEVDGQVKKNSWKSGWAKAKFQAWAKQEKCRIQPEHSQ